MTGFQLAKTSLLRRPFPSLLAIVCIAAACVSADLLVSYVRNETTSLMDLRSDYDLIIGPKSSGTELLLGALGHGADPEQAIPYSLVKYLDRVAQLDHRFSLYQLGQYRGLPVVATDPEYWNRPSGFEVPTLAEGVLPPSTREIVLGKRAAEGLGLEVGDTLDLRIAPPESTDPSLVWSAEFKVSAVILDRDPTRNETLFLPIEQGWSCYRFKVDHGLVAPVKNLEAVSYLFVSAPPDQIDLVETKIHEGTTVQVVRVEEELAFLKTLVGGANRVSNFLCLIVLLLASITVMVQINSRFDFLKQELGILRALGYTRGEIATWLTLESLIPVTLGVAFAICFELILFRTLGLAFPSTRLAGLADWPEFWNLLLWALFVLISFFASALPLFRLYRADIRTTLEGV